MTVQTTRAAVLFVSLALASSHCADLLGVRERHGSMDAEQPDSNGNDAQLADADVTTDAPQDAAGDAPDGTPGDTRAEAAMDGPVDSSMDATTDSSLDSSATLPPHLACTGGRVLTLEGAARGVTTDGVDHTSGSCGAGTAPDLAFDWVAPADDWYQIDTFASSFDTVLYARAGGCTGPELACSNNTSTVPQSELVAYFAANEHVVVFVDGNAGDQGAFVLNAQRITCPSIDLTKQPLPVTFSTVGGTQTHSGACGGDGQPEKAFRYIPKEAGLYRITAQSASFKPIVYLEEGVRCGGTVLGCNTQRTLSSTERYPAEVIRNLAAGKPVTILVDGADGSGFFDLDIARIDDGKSCGTATDLPTEQAPATLEPGASSHQTASCIEAGGSNQWGVPMALADHTYQVENTYGVGCATTYEVVATDLVNLYLVSGACQGPELRCAKQVAAADPAHSIRLGFGTADTGTYTLVVENPGTTAIQYYIQRYGICR